MKVMFFDVDVADSLVDLCVSLYHHGCRPTSDICRTITDLLLSGV